MSGFLQGRKRVALTAFAVAMLAVMAVAVSMVLLDEGRAIADRASDAKASIVATITQYEGVTAKAWVVPDYAVKEVEEQQAAICTAKDWQPTATDDEPCPSIMPEAVAAEMDRSYATALEKCCTTAFATAMIKNMPAADGVSRHLFNCPSEPLLVRIEKDVMTVELVRLNESDCIAWACVWNGDVTTEGRNVQGWLFWEYSLAKENSSWLIDGCNLLGSLEARTADGKLVSDGWGPTTRHAGLNEVFGPLSSEVYADREAVLRELDELHSEALARD